MTIEEKINKMVCTRLQEHQSKMGYNEGINIEYFATDCAIEQDRIARAETRNECLKWFEEYVEKNKCASCASVYGQVLKDFRKALEECDI